MDTPRFGPNRGDVRNEAAPPNGVAAVNPACADETRLIVFAKAPQPGSAKTRLIPLLGADGAARLQSRLTRRAVRTALAAGIGRVELWCSPNAKHPFFAALSAEYGITLHDQQGRDLGERMLHAATVSLSYRRYLLILGTDCPALTPANLRRSLLELHRGRDAVIIPAEDGGYVLLGLGRVAPELFLSINWGTERVLTQTRERLARLGFGVSELGALADLDRPEDCLKLRRERPRIWRNLMPEETPP